MASRTIAQLKRTLGAVGCALLAAPASAWAADVPPAQAAPAEQAVVPLQFDVGVFGGASLFDAKSRLGLAHDPKDVPDNSGMFGIRAGWVGMRRHLSVELEARDAIYTLRSAAAGGHVLGFRLQGLWNFLPEAKVQPFALVGIGEELLLSNKRQCGASDTLGSDCLLLKTPHNIIAGVFGVGARIPLTYRLAVRVDAHWLLEQGRAKDTSVVPNIPATAVSSNWDLSAGIAWTFGGPPEDRDKDGNPDETDKCPLEPEDKDGFEDADGCPDVDNDKDGLPDDQDKCPNQAEDKDGFQDQDGCPDPDNDRDGLLDKDDKCPNQPETKNGYKDDDGCPDVADSDEDGIPEDKDKCPKQKEDKDGFEDDDGCPDPDNDRDGILDAADKCPNQPETKNGLHDDDGCPDSLAPEVQKLLDQPTEMRFRGSALLPGGDDVFDPLLELLLEHEGVKLAISVAAEGEDDAAKATALARAEAVRSAFGQKGIDAARISCSAGAPTAAATPAADDKAAKAKAKKAGKSGGASVARPVSLQIL